MTLEKYSKRVYNVLSSKKAVGQWENLIGTLLSKLELSKEKFKAAEVQYKKLSGHIAKKLNKAEADIHIIPQGSMRTQTTIAPQGNENFDLDIVVKILNPSDSLSNDSETFFKIFGDVLTGIENSGELSQKKRCWRLQYPDEAFYFDITPAIPLSRFIVGTDLRVRDPHTKWSPSNPEEFSNWFNDIANRKFDFQLKKVAFAVEARAKIDPLPQEEIKIDDILRRTVQLIKLHRDKYYWELSESRKECKPISIILVTLAGHAYAEINRTMQAGFDSPIEVVLEVVDRLTNFIEKNNDKYVISNPELQSENFAERWNTDNGKRAEEFSKWHTQLKTDLESLFSEEYNKSDEKRIKAIFGQIGVDAWKGSLPKTATILDGLLNSLPTTARNNPTKPINSGSNSTLA